MFTLNENIICQTYIGSIFKGRGSEKETSYLIDISYAECNVIALKYIVKHEYYNVKLTLLAIILDVAMVSVEISWALQNDIE